MNTSDWRFAYSRTIACAQGRLQGIQEITEKAQSLKDLLKPRLSLPLSQDLDDQIQAAAKSAYHQVHRILDGQLVLLSKTLPRVSDPRRQNVYAPVMLSRAYAVQGGATLSQAFVDDKVVALLDEKLTALPPPDLAAQDLVSTSELFQYFVAPKVSLIDDINSELKQGFVRASPLDALLRETLYWHDVVLFLQSQTLRVEAHKSLHSQTLLTAWTNLKQAVDAAQDGSLWDLGSKKWQAQVFPALVNCARALLQHVPHAHVAGNLLHDAIRAEIADYLIAFNNAAQNHGFSVAALVQEQLTLEVQSTQLGSFTSLEQGTVVQQLSLLQSVDEFAQARQKEGSLAAEKFQALLQDITYSASFMQLQSSALLKMAKQVAFDFFATTGKVSSTLGKTSQVRLDFEIQRIENQDENLALLNRCLDAAQQLHRFAQTDARQHQSADQFLGQVRSFAQTIAQELVALHSPVSGEPEWHRQAVKVKLQQLASLLDTTFDASLNADDRSELFSTLCHMAGENTLFLKPNSIREIHQIGVNSDYCYHIDDVHDLLQETLLNRAKTHPQMGVHLHSNTVKIQEPVLHFQDKRTKTGLVYVVSDWLARNPVQELMLVPFIPDDGLQGTHGVLHWMGLVVSADASGQVTLAFLDPLFSHGQGQTQGWQHKLLQVLHEQNRPLRQEKIEIQQQHNGTLCGPLLCYAMDSILSHWQVNQNLPSHVIEKPTLDIRYDQITKLLAKEQRMHEQFVDEQTNFTRPSFLYRQYFNFA